MAAAAAAAAAAVEAWVRGGRLVSLSVPCAFLLGMLWLVSARSIAGAVAHCLAVEGSVLLDDECVISMQWPFTVGICALVPALVLPRGEALFREQPAGGAQDDGHCDPEKALQPRSRDMAPHPLAVMAFVVLFMYIPCGVLFVVGKVFQRLGARYLVEFGPADKSGAYLLKVGPIYSHAGFLALSVVHCCIIIPYVLLTLMAILWKKCVGSLSAEHRR